MIAAHRQSLTLLHAVLGAAIALPTILFAYSSWQGYRTTFASSERQIAQSRDIITEHALKVFESVDRSIAEVNEIIRDMTDLQIASNAESLHLRLKRLADDSSQIKSLWIFDRSGHALVNSLEFPPTAIDFSDRDYFRAHAQGETGTYVGEVLRPRPPYGGAPFFGVSRRRNAADGSFAGVIQASILPEYFEGFYAKISRDLGNYYSLIRQDGLILARSPPLDRDARLAPQGGLRKAIEANPAEGKLSLVSAIDAVERTVSYLKLPNLPLYVVAGRDSWAVRNEWMEQAKGQLLFGLPLTAALIAVILIAIRRTKSLYEEAQRRQAAEDALKQAQRLEALGQLTGGVAHDFNNLLMVIGGSAQKLQRLQPTSQQLRSLQMIDLAVQKGESLTKKLLSFSRRRALVPQVVDLVARIDALKGVLLQSVSGDYALDFSLPAQSIPVKIDPSEFEIALLNLVLNARDSMPNGGRIAATVTRARPPSVKGTPGEFAAVAIRDAGTGIPSEIQDRVFEPFFTTKPVDKGTGLGLSQVYGFATQAQGYVDFESQPGQGTTFTIYLPVTNEPIDPAAQMSASPKKFERRRVLLVEDNPDVAVVAAEYLQQCGCDVVKSASAEQAIEILNRDNTIDFVFSDISMPGMSGLELARLVRDHHPEIKIVLATGYSDKAALAVSEGFRLIEKPYSLDSLRASIAAEIA